MATQEDPIVMYLVVNTSLGMDAGKIAAQVGHGVSLVVMGMSTSFTADLEDVDESMLEPQLRQRMWNRKWAHGDYRKIVLAADAREFERVKMLPGATVVRDNGHTEVAAGSETVVVFKPMRASERPKLLKRLRLLTSENMRSM